MPNMGGSREAKIRLVASVVNSKLLYAAPVWTSALNNHAIQKKLISAQRGVVLRIVSAYRIVCCFNAYLKRFKKRDDESCCYCGSLVDNEEHTPFVCARWGEAREAVCRAVGAQLTLNAMVPLMIQSEQIWILIESFFTLGCASLADWTATSVRGRIFFLFQLARLVC